MINLIKKEFKLSAHILSYVFIAFGLMTFIPGYPILVGVFFFLPRYLSIISII